MTDRGRSGVVDPDAVLDWSWDWSAWLAEGETITAHDVTGQACTIGDVSVTGAVVTAWISAYQTGATATCEVTTSQGRTDQRTIRFAVVQR